VQATFGVPFPQDPEGRMWKPELGGGSTLDQGIYTITIPYLLLGKPSSIIARGTLSDAGADAEAAVMLGFSGGEQAQLSTSMTALLPLTASICGSAGQITIWAPFWGTEGFTLTRSDFTSQEFADPKEGAGYVPMLRAVGQAIAEGCIEHEILPLNDTIAVLEIMEEVIRQIKDH
jgi:predicted dehydrogenase